MQRTEHHPLPIWGSPWSADFHRTILQPCFLKPLRQFTDLVFVNMFGDILPERNYRIREFLNLLLSYSQIRVIHEAHAQQIVTETL